MSFDGFDEIYLLEEKPREGIADHFTTDVVKFNENIPEKFLLNFKKINAKRYLSDGLGLNFVCESLEMIEKIKKIRENQIL